MAEYTITGSNRYLLPGSFAGGDVVTFVGTKFADTLFGGGGETVTRFLGTPGDDLYGLADQVSALAAVDYSRAPNAVYVDLTVKGGTRSFVDDHGQTHTVSLRGMARDGFGGTDWYAEHPNLVGRSSIQDVEGSRFDDVMISDHFSFLFGGGGNDRLTGVFLWGEAGDDILRAADASNNSIYLDGGGGDDFIWGSDRADAKIMGGPGDDRIHARGGDDGWVAGDAGNDLVDGGAGNDFVIGGVGKDTLVSGAGDDTINPDRATFETQPSQHRDGARDIIKVGQQDLGDYTDVVLSRAFEAGRDQVRFAGAVDNGADYRIFYESQSANPKTGTLYRADDLAGMTNTVLQIDQDGDGFGDGVPDDSDYFLVVVDAELTLHAGYMLT